MKLQKALELIGEEKQFKSVPQALQFFIKEYHKKIGSPKKNPYSDWKKEKGIKTAWDLEDEELLEELDKYLAGCELDEPEYNVTYDIARDRELDQSDWF